MPLTSIATCYKTLPSYFADKVTRHAKRRPEVIYTNEQDADAEVRTAHTSALRDDATSGITRLMTKRSCTPLATVSDNESDDGASPRPKSKETTPRGSKRQSPSPRPQTAGSFASTWSVIHPRRTQTSPRTAISLDNVDLWEDDGSDTESFDEINGVSINPRMTIDLSDLRRSRSPVASKRNKMDEHSSYARHESEPATDQSPGVSPRRSNTRTYKWMNSNLTNINKSKSSTGIHRPRAKRPELPTSLQTDKTSPGKQNKPDAENLKLPDTVPGVVSKVTVADTIKNRELSRANLRLMSIGRGKVNSNLVTNAATQDSHFLRNTYRIQESETKGNNDSSSQRKTSTSGNSPDRKVKFNNFVQVHDGELNTLSHLRESNNSAQMIKQRYLGTRKTIKAPV